MSSHIIGKMYRSISKQAINEWHEEKVKLLLVMGVEEKQTPTDSVVY
ncbi:MAG: hypothetical protein V7K50_27520 [Nostoc sp.]